MQLKLRSGNIIIKTFKTGIPLRSGHIVKRTKFTPRPYIKKGISLRSGHVVKRSEIKRRPYHRKNTTTLHNPLPSITITIIPYANLPSPQTSSSTASESSSPVSTKTSTSASIGTLKLRSRVVNLTKFTPRPYRKKQNHNSHVEAMRSFYKNNFLATYLNLKYYKHTEEEAIDKIREWQAQEQRYKEYQATHNPKNYLIEDY